MNDETCQDAAQAMRALLQDHVRTMPGHQDVVDENGWITKERIRLPDDPDAGLIIQDPPCFLDRLHIPGYSSRLFTEQNGAGADFDPLSDVE